MAEEEDETLTPDKARKLFPNLPLGPFAARIRDIAADPKPPHPPPITTASPNVITGYRKQARVADLFKCTALIKDGSHSVLVNGRRAARVLDPTTHKGVIITGCLTVIIGDSGSQGAVLREASANGTPFCEVCEDDKPQGDKPAVSPEEYQRLVAKALAAPRPTYQWVPQVAPKIVWPPNRGFASSYKSTLQPGHIVDRYGGYFDPQGKFKDGGTFTAEAGTPYPERALPPGTDQKPYKRYQVLKPIDVDAGPTAPWFGEPGGGIQQELPGTIDELVASGHLKEIV